MSTKPAAKRSLFAVFRSLKKAYGPQRWWPADTPFEVVVGAILTQNTAWKNVEKAIGNLKRERLLSPARMRGVRQDRLARLIRPAGYFNVKARRLKNFLSFLGGRYSGSLAGLFRQRTGRLRQALLGVNGIGPETADSIALYAAGKPLFVVDAYTRRIFSRLGWVGSEAGYDRIQSLLMDGLPRRAGLYNEYHALLVEHAKRTCTPKPDCPACVLRRLCAHAKRGGYN